MKQRITFILVLIFDAIVLSWDSIVGQWNWITYCLAVCFVLLLVIVIVKWKSLDKDEK